jgi:hypothetical protein
MTISKMNNHRVDKDFLTRLKGAYQAKYGFDMDEWTPIILHEISENFATNNEETKNAINEIEKASSLITGQIKPIHFSDEKQAFYYGLGKSLPYGISVLVIGILGYFLISTNSDYKEMKALIENYENIHSYKTLMQVGNVEEQNGRLFLKLTKHNDKNENVEIGKEFFQTKDKQTIWIPLGKKQQ